jgi:hypothetical protein
MRGHYQGIRGLSACHGNRIFVRDATDQDYLDTVEEQLRSRWGRFRFWLWGLTDYGRSLMSVVIFASILIFGFGWVYSHWLGVIRVRDRRVTPFTPYYFSIVTYTTLGFGDVKPNNLAGEILVSVEVILGYLTLGLLLAGSGTRWPAAVRPTSKAGTDVPRIGLASGDLVTCDAGIILTASIGA